jgi:hypothetical protein
MTFRRRLKLSAKQRIEMWSRWKAGQSLHAIGRAAFFCRSNKQLPILEWEPHAENLTLQKLLDW